MFAGDQGNRADKEGNGEDDYARVFAAGHGVLVQNAGGCVGGMLIGQHRDLAHGDTGPSRPRASKSSFATWEIG